MKLLKKTNRVEVYHDESDRYLPYHVVDITTAIPLFGPIVNGFKTAEEALAYADKVDSKSPNN